MTDFNNDEPVPQRPLRRGELMVACQHCGHDLITTRSNFKNGHRYHLQCWYDERKEKGLYPLSEEAKRKLKDGRRKLADRRHGKKTDTDLLRKMVDGLRPLENEHD